MLPTARSGFSRGAAMSRMLQLQRKAPPNCVRLFTVGAALLLLLWLGTLYSMFGSKVKEKWSWSRAWELIGGGGRGGKGGGKKSSSSSGSSTARKASAASITDESSSKRSAAALFTSNESSTSEGDGCPECPECESKSTSFVSDSAIDKGAWKRRNFAPKSSWPPESTVQCAMWGTWTETCYYENVCFDAHERLLLFWKDPDVSGSGSSGGIPPGGAQDWAASEGTFADVAANPGVYDTVNDRDPSFALPAFSPKRMHVSHNDLLTGQVLPLAPFPRYGPHRPKLFPFNSNMKGRFMERGEAEFYWRRTAAEWAHDRGAAESDAVPPIEAMPIAKEDASKLKLSDAAAQRIVLGAPLGSDKDDSNDPAAAPVDPAGEMGPFPGEDVSAPVDDTALILSHKVQLQNIWYYSSRLTPWFEARRLNASGMLPFLLPQPAVTFLHTTEHLVGSDWHRSMLALAAGFPKDVLFPDVYPPGSIKHAAAAAGEAAPVPAAGGRKAAAKGRALSRAASPSPAPPVVVTHRNGARYWNGDRVPKVLYRAPIPGKNGLVPVPQLIAQAGGAAAAAGGDGGGQKGKGPTSDVTSAAEGGDDGAASKADGDDDGADVSGNDAASDAVPSSGLDLASAEDDPSILSGDATGADTGAEASDGDEGSAGDAAAASGESEAMGRLLLESDAADDGSTAVGGDFVISEDEQAIAADEAAAAAAAAAAVGAGKVPAPKAPIAAAAASKAASKGPSAVKAQQPQQQQLLLQQKGGATSGSGNSNHKRSAAPPPTYAPPLPRHAPEERTRCYRKLVLTGASGFVFGDTHAASEFRHSALVSLGRGGQPKFVGPGVGKFYQPHLPPKKVLLIDRKRGKPRHLTNIDAIKKLLDAYGVPYTHLVDFRGSFEEQVAAYNDHGILLGVHGAGFINCMFMRQGSAVIEIFPYHLKHTLYMRQAYAAGLTHFSVYATDPGTMFKKGNALFQYLKLDCEAWPSVMTQWKDNACRGPLIGSQVAAPMRQLEEALVNALDMIGYRTVYKGLFAEEKMMTEAERTPLVDILGGFKPSPRPSKGAQPLAAQPPKAATGAGGAGGGGSSGGKGRALQAVAAAPAASAGANDTAVVPAAVAAASPSGSKKASASKRPVSPSKTSSKPATQNGGGGSPKSATKSAKGSKAAAAASPASKAGAKGGAAPAPALPVQGPAQPASAAVVAERAAPA